MTCARLLTGIGVGGEYTAIFAAIDELIPAKYRGRVDIIVDATWHLGSLIAYSLTMLSYNLNSEHSLWRYLFILGSIGALPVLYLRQDIPESPRWLIHKGYSHEAHKMV
jgi:MFS family permease